MQRKKKLFLNTAMAIVNQAVIFISGFIVPKLIILHYGSATNGLVSSITQFMAYFSLVEAGLSGAAVFALYKPLAKGDVGEVNQVVTQAKKFYSKAGLIFIVLVFVCVTWTSIP